MLDVEYTAEFFVSHADTDLQWAEWIAFELESAGYGVILKAWDIRPGDNRLDKIDEALSTCRHTLYVLSDGSDADMAARTAAQYQGLQGKERALIPVLVDEGDGEIPPSVGALVPIDLRGVDDEDEARRRLLAGVAERGERVARAGFPNRSGKRVRFPGTEQEVCQLRGQRPDPRFMGRDDTLADLYRALRAGRPTSAVQVITGLGGLGKTQVAVEYASRHGVAYDLVWWVRAEDPTALRGDYVELATELGLPFEQDDQAIAALRQSLRRRKNWLLIFDNAEDPDELLPLLPERHAGHVLITSRRSEWPHAEFRRLDVLSIPAAVEYLRRWGGVSTADTARNLAEALGCLPLALAQAASVIADGMAATDYLSQLQKQSPELFIKGRSGNGNHQETIASTWRVSFDRLADQSSAAVALFRLAAFLGAEAIPLDRIVPVPGMPAELAEALTDPFRRTEATQALREYSLAKTGDGLMSIHRMVQAVTRTELAADESRWAGLALATMSTAFPNEVRDPVSWPTCETMLAHALSSAQHARRLRVDITDTIDLLDRVARYLLARGRSDHAAVVLEDALTSAKQLPSDTLEYLRCRNTQGLLLLNRGDHYGARQAQEEVYQARIRQLGENDVDTLRAGRDLVEALYRLGQWAQATQLQNRLVEAFTAVLGADNLETVTASAYQATLLHSAGQYRQARMLEERVLEARRRLLGDEHLANLGATLHAQGEYDRARALAEEVLDARRRLLGDEHPHTLNAIANLGAALHAQGEYDRARALAEQVLDARRRLLGDEHPETLNAVVGLGAALHAQGEYDRARALAEQVLDARRRLLGDEHPETLNAVVGLGAALHAQGEYDRARALAEQVLDARRRLLGDEHPDTLNAIANLGTALRAQGEYDRARALAEQVLDARRRLLGDEHPEALTAIANLATTLRSQGEYDRARALAEEVLDARSRILGDEHPHTLNAIANLGAALHAQGEYDRARALAEQVLDARRRLLGDEHPHTLSAIVSLGAALHAQGEYDRARASAEQVLDARRRILGDEHPETFMAIANLATALHAQGETAKAHSLLYDALTASQRAYGKKNTVTSQLAWELVSLYDAPHEMNRKRSIVIENLSWLSKEPLNRLSGEQKSIRERIKRFLFGGTKPANRRPSKRKR
ncbi:TIR domain-containing protein [Microbispora triticiradicis]|uniref:TIR domain-containing protein n=1 Tax=Microbispora triticiradicis TaxID=2200763 RepID=A0ABX9LND3_9ACTN|nr:FxSxx-COOH system tetratricopeptide repeat protein [Microbispora triticiradicis]RGA05487.1 TIR domain-containing protein [Microbispora triticiradicis]